jgi:glycosyltransferase involved in cell wall biosynthesis
VPSLDSRSYEEIQRREKRQWPELFSKHDYYFDSRFERRYARRREEIALADIVVANSSLTARSHIAAGADPQKVVTVPLAAPPPIAESKVRVGRATDPLKVIWAGPFSIRKGAHHLVAAWRQLSAGKAAQLDVYGQCTVPERLSCSITNSVVFRGSVPQKELFDAYQSADVLVFPTLSDGFGMVIAEALAHGLPVVTTDQAGAADLITPDSGLIVPAANPTAIADALRWCLDNRTRLNEMRYHALEAARRRQWVDFRRDLIVNLECGLRQSGYTPSYKRSQ